MTQNNNISLIDEITRIYQERKTPNWDSYGGDAILEDTYIAACNFAKTIPLDVIISNPLNPTIGAEPDGDITFEWYGGSSLKVLSISINNYNRLCYAFIFGNEGSSGKILFNGEFPDELSKLIKHII